MAAIPPSHALDPLWRPSAVATSVVAGEALAVVLTAASSADLGRGALFGLWSLVIQWVVLGTLGILYVLRARLRRLRSTPLALVIFATLAVVSAAVSLACWSFMSWLPWPQAQPREVATRVAVVTLTVGMLGVLAFLNYARGRRYAVEAKNAQLLALRARIQPHFLFNALNTATALVRLQPQRAEAVLLNLADLFRAALGSERHVTLADEIQLTRQYLDIESLRLGDKLGVDWTLPDPLPDVTVPALSIQPLVENAIRHGIEPSLTPACVRIQVHVDGPRLHVEVRNPAISPPPRSTGHGIGVAGVRARAEGLGDGSGRLAVGVEDAEHVARLTLPLVR